MTVTLGSHIVLASFGVALPVIIWVLHRRGLRNDDPVALGLAKRWSKAPAVLFAVGAIVGDDPQLRDWDVVARVHASLRRRDRLPFALEGIAFFIEAIYLYGWGRLPGRVHRSCPSAWPAWSARSASCPSTPG